MKTILWIVVILIVIAGMFIAFNSGAPDDVEQAKITDTTEGDNMEESSSLGIENLEEKINNFDPAKLSLQFTGYGPGKSHVGVFKKYSIRDVEVGSDNITKGTIVFDMTSVSTEIGKLDEHLCTDDFFDCAQYPEATFELGSIKKTGDSKFEITGKFTMKGISKDITFNVMQVENKYTADFLLNTNEFGFNVALADSDVRINFEIEL